MTGEIVEALRNGMFRIKLDNGHETLGYTAGKMRRFRIRSTHVSARQKLG